MIYHSSMVYHKKINVSIKCRLIYFILFALLDQLNPYSTTAVKMEALQTLLATAQLSEVVGCATWPQIKNGLQAALLDINGDEAQQEEGLKVSTLALKVFVRLIENNGPFATREGFCGLVEFLSTLYKGTS